MIFQETGGVTWDTYNSNEDLSVNLEYNQQ